MQFILLTLFFFLLVPFFPFMHGYIRVFKRFVVNAGQIDREFFFFIRFVKCKKKEISFEFNFIEMGLV